MEDIDVFVCYICIVTSIIELFLPVIVFVVLACSFYVVIQTRFAIIYFYPVPGPGLCNESIRTPYKDSEFLPSHTNSRHGNNHTR